MTTAFPTATMLNCPTCGGGPLVQSPDERISCSQCGREFRLVPGPPPTDDGTLRIDRLRARRRRLPEGRLWALLFASVGLTSEVAHLYSAQYGPAPVRDMHGTDRRQDAFALTVVLAQFWWRFANDGRRGADLIDEGFLPMADAYRAIAVAADALFPERPAAGGAS